uniref:Uncharacterized protein n=1 Tax=Palpitomonas bilix TaxID=652834 RepID=A0A7S3G709_9EUKA|mmetsp:Transcript_31050/g.81488  ORF Transcript_31050/g.81488 Transcript_31050/m.81488 type:complete len:439 (+) Transcript_31050:161-1477(+)
MEDSPIARRKSVMNKGGHEVMDLGWQEMQVKTFTKWVNSHLQKRDMEIENLQEDFKDGVKLINLLEVISDQKLGPYMKVCKHEMHKIQNVSLAVNFVKNFYNEVGIRAPLGMEDVHEGNLKIILGMVWVLILRFSIQTITEGGSGSAGKEGLLLWCQKVTKNYAEVKIENFHTSWKSGFGFAALIHYHRPDLLDYAGLVKDAEANPTSASVRVMNAAFKVAEESLAIPSLLDAEDIEASTKPDEKSVMAYVAGFWKVFASLQQEATFVKRIAGALQRHVENVKTIANYEQQAGEWRKWADEKIEFFKSQKEAVVQLEAVESFMNPFNEYQVFRISQKPSKSSKRGEFKAMLSSLEEKQKSEGRPIYSPPADLNTEALAAKWEELIANEGPFEEAMMGRLKEVAAEAFEHFDKDDSKTFDAEELEACFQVSTLSSSLPI